MTDLKLGLRNLGRNRWRSALTLAGIGVAVALMVWTLAIMEGWMAQMVRGATAVETAQAQVQTRAYADEARVYHSFRAPAALLDGIAGAAGVAAVAPRVELHGLVGHERRSQVARILGVDPTLEAAATPIEDAVVQGRWLAPDPPAHPAPREVVLGRGVARQLRVGPGDELVVFLEAADGSLGNDLLRVVGVVETANAGVDRSAVYTHLVDAQFLAALGDEIHEIAIRAEDATLAREMAAAVAAAIGADAAGVDEAAPAGGEAAAPDDPGAAARAPSEAAPAGGADAGSELLVRPWQELLPSVHQMVLISRQSYWFMYLMIYLIAAVGILNTQRMSALERKREFGVLLAVGMRPRRLFRTLLAETAVLGGIGALLGAGLGLAVSGYHAAYGLDLSPFTEGAGFSYMGVAFSERLEASLTPMAVIQPVLVMLVVALLSGLWPALAAARIAPAPTIAGRT